MMVEKGRCSFCGTTLYRHTRYRLLSTSLPRDVFVQQELKIPIAVGYEQEKFYVYSATPEGPLTASCPGCFLKLR